MHVVGPHSFSFLSYTFLNSSMHVYALLAEDHSSSCWEAPALLLMSMAKPPGHTSACCWTSLPVSLPTYPKQVVHKVVSSPAGSCNAAASSPAARLSCSTFNLNN
jgi:hypothetical protein